MNTIVNKKLTPELQEKLNKLRGYSPKSVFIWTPDLFRLNTPKEEWPLFKFSNRDAKDWADAEDNLLIDLTGEGNNARTNTANLRLMILKNHLLEWKNYKDKSGKVIPFEKDEEGQISDACLHRLSQELQLELLEAINTESCLNEEEKAGLEF